MKDTTFSAGNAAIEIWDFDDNSKAGIGMCSVHAYQRWKDVHKYLACDKENLELVNQDFESFKVVPFLSLVEILKEKMMKKWKTTYKESDFSEAWINVWGKSKITRKEMNQDAVLLGGHTK